MKLMDLMKDKIFKSIAIVPGLLSVTAFILISMLWLSEQQLFGYGYDFLIDLYYDLSMNNTKLILCGILICSLISVIFSAISLRRYCKKYILILSVLVPNVIVFICTALILAILQFGLFVIVYTS